MEWPAKRCYVGLVAVSVQEQAEDILVPPLLRKCLTFNYIPFLSHYLPPQNSGPGNRFYCLGHFKNVYDDDDIRGAGSKVKVKGKRSRPYSSSQEASPLRELTCHMGSHSITCHPAEVTFPPVS